MTSLGNSKENITIEIPVEFALLNQRWFFINCGS